MKRANVIPAKARKETLQASCTVTSNAVFPKRRRRTSFVQFSFAHGGLESVPILSLSFVCSVSLSSFRPLVLFHFSPQRSRRMKQVSHVMQHTHLCTSYKLSLLYSLIHTHAHAQQSNVCNCAFSSDLQLILHVFSRHTYL